VDCASRPVTECQHSLIVLCWASLVSHLEITCSAIISRIKLLGVRACKDTYTPMEGVTPFGKYFNLTLNTIQFRPTRSISLIRSRLRINECSAHPGFRK
jgi:hypothetical protein